MSLTDVPVPYAAGDHSLGDAEPLLVGQQLLLRNLADFRLVGGLQNRFAAGLAQSAR